MHCPFCNAQETKVVDSRLIDEGSRIRRRRECLDCSERFSTYEYAELDLPRVVKRDGQRCAFEQDKLKAGMLRALEKRPVSMEQLDVAIHRIIHQLRASGERELSSKKIGEMVMDELHELDKIAYVRFASVYRSFEDINAFNEEIQRLQERASEQ